MHIRNILDTIDKEISEELFEKLAGNEKVKIERIISTGQTTLEGKWLVQETSEFVLLLVGKATLEFKKHGEIDLVAGDHIVIPSDTAHRVAFTQKNPATIWLTVHF